MHSKLNIVNVDLCSLVMGHSHCNTLLYFCLFILKRIYDRIQNSVNAFLDPVSRIHFSIDGIVKKHVSVLTKQFVLCLY